MKNVLQRLLSLLGFSAALSACDNGGTVVCMYGMPVMDYSVSGKVQDAAGTPIEGIEVTSESDYNGTTVLTSSDGSFTLESRNFPGDSITLMFNDIDGDKNGAYADKTQEVSLKQTEKSDDAWYSGKYEASGVVVTMEEKSL